MSQKETFLTTSPEELVIFFGDNSFKNCTYEYESVTKKNGWKAPKDKAFKISGQFEITEETQPSDYIFNCQMVSQSSFDKLKDDNPDIYKKILKKTPGNEESAIQRLIKHLCLDEFMYGEDEIPLKSFTGKWLMFGLDCQHQEISVNINQIESWYKKEELFYDIDDVNPQSPIITSCYFSITKKIIVWQQHSAFAGLNDKYYVELVDFPEENTSIYVPETDDNNHPGLSLPKGTKEKGVRSENEFNFASLIRSNLDFVLLDKQESKQITIAKSMEDVSIVLRKNK